MTDRLNNDTNRDKINQTGLLRWKNMSGETIPAYACVKLSTFNNTGRYYNAVKPDGEGNLHFFNGGIAIASESFGESFIWGQSSVLGLTSGVFGEIVGPVADSWEMTTGGSGYAVFSNPDGNSVAAILRNGSGGGGSHAMWFVIVAVLCPDGYEVTQKTLKVTPIWYTGFCGQVPPGRQDDGTWHVYDICQYLMDQVDEELPGTLGRAKWFYPYTADDYSPPACVPAWILEDLCHQPECP